MPRFAARFATGFLEIVRYRAGRERTAQPMLLLYFNTVSDDATQEGVPDRLRRVFRAVRNRFAIGHPLSRSAAEGWFAMLEPDA